MDGQWFPRQRVQFEGRGFPIIAVPQSFSFVGYCVSTSSSLNFGSLSSGTRAAGDIAIFVDFAGFASAPSAVTPSGFTNHINTSNSNGRGMLSTKKMTGSEGSVSGMNTSFMHKVGLVIRPAASFTSIVASTPTSQMTSGDPSSQAISPSGETDPVIVIGVGAGAGGTVTFSTASPAFDGTVAPSSDDLIVGHKIYNASPANHTIDITGSGSNPNWLAGIYLKVS